MPARYDFNAGATRVTCSHCDHYITVAGRVSELNADSRILASYGANRERDSLVREWLRWLPNRNRFHAWCRECEREARREAAAATPNRETRRRAPNTSDGVARRHEGRKFGVELELIFPRGMDRYQINAKLQEAGLPSTWRVKSDGSLTGGNGMEVVSPPLSGENGFDQLQIACRVLRRMGAKPNRSCGTHVHHDVADLDVDAIKRVAHGWSANQNLIDGLVSPSRRGNGSYYAQPLTPADLSYVDRAQSLSDMRNVGIQRYRTMNLSSYGRHGTVEIRQHQGTGDFEKIRSWVMLGQAIIDSAKAAPLPRHGTVRGLLEGFGDLLDSTAKTFTLGRALEFGYATV